ncbi:uncharacterized protein LAESUDRAFT_713552 [Laetiporus sulphureus 93-53]|uniref:BTB domain-containing protein n=1 Tax=Laetiporus sulphureus 93-53 TaxID=1314785 RepID=A0A165ENN4_9APHY|nr:uncharacterized protein LAESUDRAFT_713552 [Laetiporus sulphureus 93-53]KZT07440.1 hypothetical protein LAESUDRAFT_713552 [Laetiporus sulphureus 93-53]
MSPGSPHVGIATSPGPPHVGITTSPRSPHIDITMSPGPPHVGIATSPRPPHVGITVFTGLPHFGLVVSPGPSHVELITSPPSPQVGFVMPHFQTPSFSDPMPVKNDLSYATLRTEPAQPSVKTMIKTEPDFEDEPDMSTGIAYTQGHDETDMDLSIDDKSNYLSKASDTAVDHAEGDSLSEDAFANLILGLLYVLEFWLPNSTAFIVTKDHQCLLVNADLLQKKSGMITQIFTMADEIDGKPVISFDFSTEDSCHFFRFLYNPERAIVPGYQMMFAQCAAIASIAHAHSMEGILNATRQWLQMAFTDSMETWFGNMVMPNSYNNPYISFTAMDAFQAMAIARKIGWYTMLLIALYLCCKLLKLGIT